MFASQLSNHLLISGHEVCMISLLSGEGELPFKGKLIQLGRPIRKRLVDFAGWKLLAHYIKDLKPDVVQANAGDTLKFAVLSKVLFRWNTPIVFRNANKVSDFINSWPKLVFNKFLVNRVSHVISVSELCRLDFIKTYTYHESKTTTGPIGVELQTINPLPHDLRSIFESGKVLMHVASFVQEKNHSGLLQIVKKLVDRGVNIKVILIGDGKLRQEVKQQVIDLGLDKIVFLLGYRNDVLSIMSHAHTLILPSKIEGLPGVILEAMYCRLPVIAYDVGGISEVVKSGETGWLVKAGDEESFVVAIQERLNSPNLNVLKEKAYNLVMKEYDNRVIAQRFIEVYKKVASH